MGEFEIYLPEVGWVLDPAQIEAYRLAEQYDDALYSYYDQLRDEDEFSYPYQEYEQYL